MMKEMPLGIAMGAMVFFYDLGMELSKATLKYMEAHKKDKIKSSQPNQTSPLDGDGLAQFTNLAEEIYSSLTVLPHNPPPPVCRSTRLRDDIDRSDRGQRVRRRR